MPKWLTGPAVVALVTRVAIVLGAAMAAKLGLPPELAAALLVGVAAAPDVNNAS